MVEVTTMDKEIVDRYLSEVNIFFKTNYRAMTKTLKSGTLMYTGRTSKGDIYKFFHSITNNKFNVPIEAFRSRTKTKLDFIAGLFDTDGSVARSEDHRGNPRWQLKFSGNKLGLVEEVASLLRSLNIRVGEIGQYKKQEYATMYSIQPNIKDFIDCGGYFQSQRKQQRLYDYLNHVLGSETMYTTSLTKDDDIVHA